MNIVITDNTPPVEITITENNVPVFVSVCDRQPVVYVEIKEGGGGSGTIKWSEILEKPLTFTPSAHTHDWSDIRNAPTVFPPATHTHTWSQITEKPVLFSGNYNDLYNIPVTFAPSAHTHQWSEITNKPNFFSGDYNDLNNAPDLDLKAESDASNIDPFIEEWKDKLGAPTFLTGPKTATTTSIDIALHSSGENWAKFAGVKYAKTVAEHWDFPEVTMEQVFTVYALPDLEVFHLALDGEEIPEGALIVAEFSISENWVSVIDNINSVKFTNSDAWRSFTIVNSAPYTINMVGSLASSFRIKSTVANPKLGLVSQKLGRSFWDGSEFVIFNDSDNPLELTAETFTENEPYKYLTFEPYTIPPNKWVLLKVLEGVLVVAKLNEEIDNSTIGNIEGGNASSIYLITQQINGGNA